ncbi:hypothetical protein MIMGU_mgv1a022235mg, partial [Erythranthe guttata]
MDRISRLIVFCGIYTFCASAQHVYIVGSSMGWDIPSNTSVSYSNWAMGKTFNVDDIVGNFVTNEHDVVRVPKASYDVRTRNNAVGDVIAAGNHHYICTLGRYCQFGPKLTVTVLDSSAGGGANPPATTPSPATPQPDAGAPTTNAECPTPATMAPRAGPPPPDSASASLTARFLFL